MRKIFLYLMVIFLISCATKKEVSLPSYQKLSEKEALNIIEKYISKQFDEKGYVYYKTIPNLKMGRILFIWKNDELSKYHVRYFIVSGKNRYVELTQKGGDYIVSVKKGTAIVNCYGYTHKIPNIFDLNMKINFDPFSQSDCKSAIRFILQNPKEAEELASALSTIFSVDTEDEPILNPKINSKDVNTIGENKCSVDKILKMKEIGLSADEIKKICE
ncbi:MAG: hypothetical protein N3C60_10045 [Calditerrivibrio sp.]|nr:hypothetical protein [Calditerrivibrio sp.]